MKDKTSGVVKLLLSVLVIFIFFNMYYKIFAFIGITFKGTMKEIMDFLRYVISAVIIFVIYRGIIKAGKRSFERNLLNNVIYSVSCFIFLIVITILTKKLLNYFGWDVGYPFKNYFASSFSLSSVLTLIEGGIIIPFLLSIIFPLGFSEVFNKPFNASLASGVCYGILNGLKYHILRDALIYSLTPAIVVMLLTYLYKTNKNIWSVVITYISYVLFGIFLLNYIV